MMLTFLDDDSFHASLSGVTSRAPEEADGRLRCSFSGLADASSDKYGSAVRQFSEIAAPAASSLGDAQPAGGLCAKPPLPAGEISEQRGAA